MKIADVAVHVVRPLDESPWGPDNQPSYVFVAVTTDDGITGWGECSNWLHGSDLIVATAVREIGRGLLGADPSRIELIWNETYRRYTYLGSRGVITTALSGIDIALWDIAGQAVGQPIHRLLGGRVNDEIVLYTHPGGGSPGQVADQTVSLLEQGFSGFKYDPFDEVSARHTNYRNGEISRAGIARGAAVIAAVREAVGPDPHLMIDLHGHYNVESAVRCIEALEPYGVTWFEEPVPPESVAALAQIRRRTEAALCVGERLFTRWDFAPILSAGLADMVMPDVCWTGGISEVRKIATFAETFNILITPHGATGPLQAWAGAQAMAATPNFWRLEILGPATVDIYGQALTEPLPIEHGRFVLGDAPGLGARPNPEVLASRAHPDWDPR